MSDHHGRFYFRYPSGESRADVVQRLVTFFGKVRRSRYPNHIVVLHGVTQRAFRMAWCNRSVEWFESEPNPENASVLVLRRDASRHWADTYLEEK
jgi:2,3-bisphosphoglycerate-dependent phosphoglycerate mutase